jgi:hypothetical protein
MRTALPTVKLLDVSVDEVVAKIIRGVASCARLGRVRASFDVSQETLTLRGENNPISS